MKKTYVTLTADMIERINLYRRRLGLQELLTRYVEDPDRQCSFLIYVGHRDPMTPEEAYRYLEGVADSFLEVLEPELSPI